MIITDPLFYMLAVPAVLVVGISKGGFGGGLGILGVPLMALVIGPVQAAAILLPILCVMDLFGLHAFRGIWDKTNLKIMLPASAIGILAGALTFHLMSESAIRLVIGGIAVSFTLHHWVIAPRLKSAGGTPPGPSWRLGGPLAATAGFTSFVAHAGGPPVALYLLPQRMDRRLFAGTTVIFYFFINYLKLIPYGLLGQLSYANLLTSAVLLPLAPIGVWLGIWMLKHITDIWFYRICYGFLFLTGLKLIYDGIFG